jgi:hypothetical protein
MFQGSQQIGHLDWRDGAMEAYTADGSLVGKYPTRREAASALWATSYVTTRRWRTTKQRAVTSESTKTPTTSRKS